MKRYLPRLSTILAIVLGATIGMLAQLPGPPVGIPQTVQNSAYGYNYQYTFTPNSTTLGDGVRIAPTLNLINGASTADYMLDVGGTFALPNATSSAVTLAGIHAGTIVCTTASGTITTCANEVIEAAPATGTNKYSLWAKGDVEMGATPVSLAGSLSCGALTGPSFLCANTNQAGTFKVLTGDYTLGNTSATILGITPAFTSATSYTCVGTDVTTATPLRINTISGSSFIVQSNSALADVISVICAGN